LLQTFNAFDEDVATNPGRILSNLNNYLAAPLDPSMVFMQTSEQTFRSTSTTYSSSQETQAAYVASLGLKSHFGAYSGSLKVNVDKSSYSYRSSVNFGYNAALDCGTCSFYRRDDSAKILACLDPDFSKDLLAIDTLAKAATFTAKYGTHIVLSVNLGGSLFISTTADCSKNSDSLAVSAAIKLKYKGVGSMSAAASCSVSLSKTYADQSFSYSISTVGGSSTEAAKLDPNAAATPENPAPYSVWSDTCTTQSVQSIGATKELWELLPDTDTDTDTVNKARDTLKRYIKLPLLIQSLNHPTVFSNATPISSNTDPIAVSVTPPPGYKVISGGATVSVATATDNNNFLTGSCPMLNDRGQVTGWCASAKKLPNEKGTYYSDYGKESTDDAPTSCAMVTVYAIAVYDPFDLMDVVCVEHKVNVVSQPSGNPATPPTVEKAISSDSTLTTPDALGYVLTGGGCNPCVDDGAPLFLNKSVPNSNADGWACRVQSYGSNPVVWSAYLTTYAIGIKVVDLDVACEVTQTKINNSQHPRAIAFSTGAIIGGGLQIEQVKSSDVGNLIGRMYPSDWNCWSTVSDDFNGNGTPVNATAFAITLKASMAS
jgi:hypothetical protein